ncbi:putative Methyltransferase type 11 [Candidatus Hydrogenisulfobacillus filiaventi]|uniref:Putative Methyltransferase type 11 n=1 Tax=Candidatus Hydrogenisulfobacillus filiaventi TaxID=2707344 RepID=A0A6F8ZFE7_9FIRM|nr:putative Methyltransferase type 11 [Candidatus Hydrogenisulfobacillus filiaventi]
MSGTDDRFRTLLQLLESPGLTALIRHGLEQEVVLDTWMNDEQEEHIAPPAEAILSQAAEILTRRALAARAVYPSSPMPEGFVRSLFSELLTGTALYRAHRDTGTRLVTARVAEDAVARVMRFIAVEGGVAAASRYCTVINTHEDLNAIGYYGRMPLQDFLFGTLHRPWSTMILSEQLNVYREWDLVRIREDAGEGWLSLTPRGEAVLARLRTLLETAGEFAWRTNAQRSVIFGEINYDDVFEAVFPDANRVTRAYVESLALPAGARVLEIGAGTGRMTFDLGLAERVAAVGGTMVALDPSENFLRILRQKQRAHEAGFLTVVQGVVEALPFPERWFDVTVSAFVLHFTDFQRAAREMVRVTRPGGLIATLTSYGSSLDIPMVAAWFSPLQELAQRLDIRLFENRGLSGEMVKASWEAAGITDIQVKRVPVRSTAADPQAFLDFVLRGGAFFQGLLSRIPFQERWRIIRELERTGREYAARSRPEDLSHGYYLEMVYGHRAK